jgi:hypothetical protein
MPHWKTELSGKLQRSAHRLLYGMPDRYGHLAKTILRRRSRRIMEIGVWDAIHSVWMIEAALVNHRPEDVVYYGFDLFEDLDPETLERETSKAPPTMAHVRGELARFVDLGVRVHLFRGDTKVSLPRLVDVLPIMDFVFIDGGHSEATVRSDWSHVERLIGPETVVIFDDYVDLASITASGVGVNAVVDSIDRRRYAVRRLRPVDSFPKEWGALSIALARVTPRVPSGV